MLYQLSYLGIFCSNDILLEQNDDDVLKSPYCLPAVVRLWTKEGATSAFVYFQIYFFPSTALDVTHQNSYLDIYFFPMSLFYPYCFFDVIYQNSYLGIYLFFEHYLLAKKILYFV